MGAHLAQHPHGDSPLHYVSTGVLGELGAGSGLSIGIGEGMPFECVVSTWMNTDGMARYLNSRRLPGVRFEPIRFKSRRVKNRTYSGVRVRFTNRATAPLMAINYHIVDAVKSVAKRDLFATRTKSGRSFNMFDKVNGTDMIRRDLAPAEPAPKSSVWPGTRPFPTTPKYLLQLTLGQAEVLCLDADERRLAGLKMICDNP